MKLLVIWVLLILLVLSGCISSRARQAEEQAKALSGKPNGELNRGLVWLALAGIVGACAGVALGIWLPGDDHVPQAIIWGFASMTGVAIFLLATLAWIKWVCLAGLVLGVIYLGLKFYKRFKVERLMEVTT